jgi:hypothetical protein
MLDSLMPIDNNSQSAIEDAKRIFPPLLAESYLTPPTNASRTDKSCD